MRTLATVAAASALAVSTASAWPPPVRFDDTGMLRIEAASFEARVAPEMLDDPEHLGQVVATLRRDLAHVGSLVPGPALATLRERVVFWIEAQGATVPGGMSGRGMVFHPSAFWLRANGLDPSRAGGIEIVRAADYLAWRTEQPMMVLHELAHAWHHAVGTDDEGLAAAFESARDEGRYERVRRAGRAGLERAYAMNNPLEYFAELSEAYFGRNDFEPFDRAELASFDPAGLEAVARLWNSPVRPEEPTAE